MTDHLAIARQRLMDIATAAQFAQNALAALESEASAESPVATPPPFSQRDHLWSSHQLGTSNKTIGSHGCVVTCLAMLLQAFSLDETPATVNVALTARHGYHNMNLVIWESVQRIWPSVNFVGKHNCITTSAPTTEINRRLALGLPVIAWLDFSVQPGLQQHFVLLVDAVIDPDGETTDYTMLDPWTGERDSLVAVYAQNVVNRPWLLREEGIVLGVRYYELSGA